MREKLINLIIECINKNAWNQAEAARHLNITQPTVSLLVNRKNHSISNQHLTKKVWCLGLPTSISKN